MEKLLACSITLLALMLLIGCSEGANSINQSEDNDTSTTTPVKITPVPASKGKTKPVPAPGSPPLPPPWGPDQTNESLKDGKKTVTVMMKKTMTRKLPNGKEETYEVEVPVTTTFKQKESSTGKSPPTRRFENAPAPRGFRRKSSAPPKN